MMILNADVEAERMLIINDQQFIYADGLLFHAFDNFHLIYS